MSAALATLWSAFSSFGSSVGSFFVSSSPVAVAPAPSPRATAQQLVREAQEELAHWQQRSPAVVRADYLRLLQEQRVKFSVYFRSGRNHQLVGHFSLLRTDVESHDFAWHLIDTCQLNCDGSFINRMQRSSDLAQHLMPDVNKPDTWQNVLEEREPVIGYAYVELCQ